MFACTYNVTDYYGRILQLNCAEDRVLARIAGCLIALTAAVFLVFSCRLCRKVYVYKSSDEHGLEV